ncbi:radical SAM protein, partial [bacterium]|nr:radical SAM protein [bacterium]
RAIDICKRKIERGVNVPYYLPDGIRADSVNEELAMLLRKSGCKGVSIGVEDANPLTYKYINKGEELEDVIRGIKILKKAGVPVRVSMIIGLPHTTYESTKQSMEFIKTLDVHSEWYLAIPFPRTQLYKWVENNGRFLENPLSRVALTFRTVVFDTPDFTKEDRLKAFYHANMDYSFPEKAFFEHRCQPLYQKDSLYEIFIDSYKTVWKYNRWGLAKHTLRLIQYLSWGVKRRLNRVIHKDKIRGL